MADVNFLVEIPVANTFKFILDGANSDERADFDQRRFSNVKNASVEPLGDFKYPVESADDNRVQYYSNFPLQRIAIVDCDDNIYNPATGLIDPAAFYTPAVAVNFRGKKYRSDAKFSSIDGKLFIYFAEGFEYSDEDFLVPGNLVALDGRLPNINGLPGDVIRFSLNEVDFLTAFVVTKRWSPPLQAEGYLTDLDYTLFTPVDGLFEITYNEKPANLYSQLVSFAALPEGEYFVRLSFGVAAYTISFTTEPLDVQASHPDTLALKYSHLGVFDRSDLWSYIYLTGWTNIIRLPADFFNFTPAGDLEVDTNDSGIPRILRAIPYRQLTLKLYNMPSWLADKVQIAVSHDTKVINDYEWEIENYGQFEMINQLDQGTYEINMRQKNDRTKKINAFVQEITASFDPDSFTNIVFAGDTVTAEFISNTLATFYFLTLPDWITADHPTFVNGDVIEFTIDPNVPLFERTAELTAITDAFQNVTAIISFHQLYDTSTPPPPEFIEVSDETVELANPAGSNIQIAVSSSGDYTITPIGPHIFVAVKENGFLNVRISEPTQNTGFIRAGSIRLALISNPAVFVDVTVTQAELNQMISVDPSSLTFLSGIGSTQIVAVDVEPGTSWQATASHSWINVNTGIKTGDQSFNIFVEEKDAFITETRYGLVIFTNVLGSSDSLTVNIQQ